MNAQKPVLGYILKGYPRISETFISNEILRLEQQGFTLKLFPMRKPRESFSHESVKKIQAEVHYLPTHLFKNFLSLILPNIMLLLRSPKTYSNALSLALKRFARNRKIATFKHLLQAGYMVQKHLADDSSIQHLHGHFAHSPTSVTMFASILSELPFSFTAHAKDIYTSNKAQLKEKLEMASFVVTCTQYNAKYLGEVRGAGKTPIYCNYHGIDTSLFQANGARINCSPPYTLLTVARITEKKGLPTLYQALKLLKERGMPFKHILIGDGDDREAILQLIKELQLEDSCTWLGTQTHAEVLQHFKASDLFILGCQIAKSGDRDGIPNVLVESLAMGVPAVSTDVSAIPEIIKNGETGITVSSKNSEKMADAIAECLTNSDLRRKIITSGQQYVRENFDNVSLTKQLAEIYEKHCVSA